MPDTIDFSRKPVLVLGASGYIGSRVVAALSTSPIFRPVAASRRAGRMVDATDPTSLRAVFDNVYSVVNCIGGNNRTMVRSTEVLCEVARASPPRRIVHLSSMAVYGAATGVVQEAHEPVAPVSGYGQAKIECERIVEKFIGDGGDAVILRPTCVFGPDSPQWTTRVARLLKARRIGDLGVAGDGGCNLVFIGDLVSAIVAALDAPDISGQVFNVSGPADLTWNEFFLLFGKALAATPIRRISPLVLKVETKLFAPVLRVAARVIGASASEAITPSLAALWQQDIRIDCSAADLALSLPRTPVDEMLATVVRNDVMEPALS